MKKRLTGVFAFLALLTVVVAFDLDPPDDVRRKAAQPRIRPDRADPSRIPTTRTRTVPAPARPTEVR
jgi:hypothetical protein